MSKKQSFSQRSKFLSKIKDFVKSQNFCQKSNFVKSRNFYKINLSNFLIVNFQLFEGVDNTVRIWNTVDWKEETKISDPFTDPNNGHVMRISWSPDGTYLIAGSAVNNGGPTAQVISRKWKTGFDLGKFF